MRVNDRRCCEILRCGAKSFAPGNPRDLASATPFENWWGGAVLALYLDRCASCDYSSVRKGISMARESMHIEPVGATATARHYIRDIVYGANDGLITTFAVVGGVAGGALSSAAVIVIGAANLAADGVSMGVGNLLSIRADEHAREAADLPELEAYPWKHGIATTLAFIIAGTIPLLPYLLPGIEHRLWWSSCLTFVTLFAMGASRALVTIDRWWRSGFETLALGAVVALAAYLAGRVGASLAATLP